MYACRIKRIKKENKIMARKAIKMTNMSSKEMISAIAAKSGLTQRDTELTLKAAGEVLKDCAESGRKCNFFGFGKLNYVTVKGKPEREGITNPKTQERGTLPPTESYSKPVFRISKTLTDRIKENSKGRPFVD